MQNFKNSVIYQYTRENIYETIVQRLHEQGVEKNKITREHISSVDEFHIKGAEVSLEMAKEAELSKELKVLDVGCGIGGPARMIADVFGCSVTGVDLTNEFIRTASLLSQLVGLSGKTEFIIADATELPFEDNTFDVVWTQHAQMNIEEKEKLYSEIHRVLKREGRFIYYDIFSSEKEDLKFPLPWADDSSISFLIKLNDFGKLMKETGFKELLRKERTSDSIDFFETVFENNKKEGSPKIGLNIFMTEQTSLKLSNLLNNLSENKLKVQSGIYQKT